MGVRAISFAGAKGDRFSCCLGCGGVDFVEDNAIATTARIPTGNSMFSSFTGNRGNSSYSKFGSFSRGQGFTFLAQRNYFKINTRNRQLTLR